MNPEQTRLAEDARREQNWKRWGPYLSDRQWSTVREDYSANGACWDYFPHDHARSRAYRWGEDGLLGFTDRECRLCFALALWNGHDPILKERLYGLTGPEGNHGEDAKELYYYLDSTPTHTYAKALYKYPQAAFPYTPLREENARRGRDAPEFEILETGVFDHNRYFDVGIEYAKQTPDDILIRVTLSNRGPDPARLHVLPTLWFRNTWIWGCEHEGCTRKPRIAAQDDHTLITEHETLGPFAFVAGPAPNGTGPRFLFTENESNSLRLWGTPSYTPYVKDAFHAFVIDGNEAAINPQRVGTKAAAHYTLTVPAHAAVTLRLRLCTATQPVAPLTDAAFDASVALRIQEADAFYSEIMPDSLTAAERVVQRQAYAGLLWSKQFYHYSVNDWLKGDQDVHAPPAARAQGRNAGWKHLFNRDVISMPDKWEYPWYAAWDLAFHMIPFAKLDPDFAKAQLILMLREWYMHPNGQIPAYEFAFDDVNPPVHAWACWRVYKMTGAKGQRDLAFLEKVFHKLLLNFTWWVNRKDPEGRNLFGGGFLGLDNIGVFDRSGPLPDGGRLAQADGTAWMAFFCSTMLSIALELAAHNPAYEDIASKFFEHFVAIADAMNHLGGHGLWDEQDGFYYDQLIIDGNAIPLKLRSMVGLIPLYAVEVLDRALIDRLPGFKHRMQWFLDHRRDLLHTISIMDGDSPEQGRLLLAIPTKARLTRVLNYLLDEQEFLAPHGVRALSKFHAEHPFVFHSKGTDYRVPYTPGESDSGIFGGNSNWRGPIWFPVNFLLIEALERYHYFYGSHFTLEFPKGSGKLLTLGEIAAELSRRLCTLFLPDANGHRPCHDRDRRYAEDPHFRELVLFYEYFHGDTGRGVGASHQTGWTGLVAKLLTDAGAQRLLADG